MNIFSLPASILAVCQCHVTQPQGLPAFFKRVALNTRSPCKVIIIFTFEQLHLISKGGDVIHQ